MKDEIILKLLKGTEADLRLAMNYLIVRSQDEVKYFFEKYGKFFETGVNYLLCSNIVTCEWKEEEVMVIKSNSYWIAAYINRLYMLNPKHYEPYGTTVNSNWIEI